MKLLKPSLIAVALLASFAAHPSCLLQKDTADTSFSLGPFIDDTDFKTPETGLTVTSSEVLLKKKGSTTYSAKNDATACTHRIHGMMTCPLNATDTDTGGDMDILVAESGALIVRKTCMVFGSSYYDILDGTTDLFTSLMAGLSGGTTVATATSQTEFILTDGPSNNDAFMAGSAVLFVGGSEKCGATVADYIGTTKALHTKVACPDMTVAAGDDVYIFVGASGPAIQTAQLDLDLITGPAGVLIDGTGVDSLWAKIPPEPTGVPNWSSPAIDWIAWIGAWSRNEVQSTSSLKTLRNDADDADIATCGVGDVAGTFQRDECL